MGQMNNRLDEEAAIELAIRESLPPETSKIADERDVITVDNTAELPDDLETSNVADKPEGPTADNNLEVSDAVRQSIEDMDDQEG